VGDAPVRHNDSVQLMKVFGGFASAINDSDAGVPVEMISRLVGHRGTSVTEIVYRHQIRPVIQTGATVMDELFGQAGNDRWLLT
jgi:hypothetical protein